MASRVPIHVPLRKAREALVYAALGACGLFTLTITGAIITILTRESVDFFCKPHPDAQGKIAEKVSIWEFLTGLQWTPLLGSEKHFGIWPLILGTLKVTCVAMAFALPCGLVTAIWLSEYAAPRTRAIIKPILELLAGVPTVVFGFFALSVITPTLQTMFKPLGITFGVYNALSAGIAVGILCLPIVVSMAEDTLRAVPKALREGCYGLGASKFETSVKVVVPAAMSGIIAASLLAISRAVGETMVVALAAGSKPIEMLRPALDANGQPLLTDDHRQAMDIDWGNIFSLNSDVQAMTGYMVERFKGDAPHGTVEFSSSYAVAATLFVITLGLTLLGNLIRRKFRQSIA